jgi:hypothetical protein
MSSRQRFVLFRDNFSDIPKKYLLKIQEIRRLKDILASADLIKECMKCLIKKEFGFEPQETRGISLMEDEEESDDEEQISQEDKIIYMRMETLQGNGIKTNRFINDWIELGDVDDEEEDLEKLKGEFLKKYKAELNWFKNTLFSVIKLLSTPDDKW